MTKYVTYNTPPCPCCGRDISPGFRSYLEGLASLPGAAGQYKCPKCGEPINYILAQSVQVDVLPCRGEKR